MLTSLLAERPLLLSLMLGVVAAGLGYGWLQSGKRTALLAAVIAIAMIPAAWIIAANWVTDREQIERLLYEIAAAVEANDHERAIAVIGDEKLRRRAATELQNYEFTEASVQRVRRIEVIPGTFLPEAEVELTVKVTIGHRGLDVRGMTIPRRLLLRLEKRSTADGSGNWVVVDYQHGPIAGGSDAFSTITRP